MALAPFSSVDRTALRWLRTAEAPATFSLLSGETPVANLAFAHGRGSLATATTADAVFTLKRAGFLSPTIEVRRQGEPRAVARLLAHLRYHELRIAGAPSYVLQHVSHLVPGWRLRTGTGAEVLHIEPVAERSSLRGGAVVVSARADAPETLLLLLLSWYFVVLASFEDEMVEALAPFEGPDAPLRPGWAAAPEGKND